MLFTAVFNFILALFTPTASTTHLLSTTRKKYGESTFRNIRHTEYVTKKLQKAKCDVEFNRACLLYNLQPRFLQFHLWKKKFDSSEQCQQFKRQCLIHEFESRHKDTIRLEKELRTALTTLEKTTSATDFFNIKRHLQETATNQRDQTMQIHHKKLETIKQRPRRARLLDNEKTKWYTTSPHTHLAMPKNVSFVVVGNSASKTDCQTSSTSRRTLNKVH